MPEAEHISIAIVGSGGAGALTAGNFLLEAASLAGWHGLLTRTVGPQIRGGEAAALVRLSRRPVECLADRLDLLVGIDWQNVDRFGAEIEGGPQSLVITHPPNGHLPAFVSRPGARSADIPIKEMAKTIPEGRSNMIALGIAAGLLALSENALSTV